MEILPLLLLLSMGVIISTTCAKYSFHPAHLNQSHEQVALLQSAPVSSDLRHDGPLSEGDSGQPDPESPHHAGQPQHPLFAQLAKQYSVMRLRWLSNSSVTCNDGTRAGYYVRHSPSSRRWLIYLEGGWYCMSKATCDQRWAKMREYMTSFRWSQVKSLGGILSPSSSSNPHWWDANHVFIPYCSSDIWSGDASPQNEMAFLGSRIIDEVIKELLRTPLYRFHQARFVLLAGSSAGAAGVMINLDRVARMIADSGSLADVRGLADSGWILENDYLEGPNCADPAHCPPTDSIRGAYRLWKSRVPEGCASEYPSEPWRCYFGHRLYPSLRTPLFVLQYQYDEFQLYMDGISSRPLSEEARLAYLAALGHQMRSTLANVSAVFAPSCVSHIALTKPDWHRLAVGGVTLPAALDCWEHSPLPQATRPPTQTRPPPAYSPNYYQEYPHYFYPKPVLPSAAYYQHSKSRAHMPSAASEPGRSQEVYSVPVIGTGRDESSQPRSEQNELSQFYAPSRPLNLKRDQSGQQTESARQHYASLQRHVLAVEESDEPVVRPSEPASSAAGSGKRPEWSGAESPQSKPPGKKRKKRKRRKNHHNHSHNHNHAHHRRPHSHSSPSGPSPGITTSNTIYRARSRLSGPDSGSSVLQNDGQWQFESYPSGRRPNHPWASQPDEAQGKCQFRLLDEPTLVQRNTDCPRFYKSYLE